MRHSGLHRKVKVVQVIMCLAGETERNDSSHPGFILFDTTLHLCHLTMLPSRVIRKNFERARPGTGVHA